MGNKERIARIEARMSEIEARLEALEKMALYGCLSEPEENKSLKPIDWSQVSPIVPVKVWDERDEEDEALIMYPAQSSSSGVCNADCWERRSLITGIDIAWHGDECPLPNGVVVEVTTRQGYVYQKTDARAISWQAPTDRRLTHDIISFRVIGIASGWTEDLSTTKEAGE